MARALFLFSSFALPVTSLDFADPFLGQGTVIQRGVATPLWGTSADGQVDIKIDDRLVATTLADSVGHWSTSLPAMEAAFNRTLTITDRSGARSLTVSFGDVLMCAGQSNMDMAVNYGPFHADNGSAECAAAGRYTGGISLKGVQGRPTIRPVKDRGDIFHWFPVTPESLSFFSAVCWYTGKALYEHHAGQVPIGLIQGENGGTPIEKFIPNASIEFCGAREPPRTCQGQPDQFFYNTIVGRLRSYSMGAIIWDQAEADMMPLCQHIGFYPCLERELVRTWREAFGGPHVPFIAVQLPGYTKGVFDMRLAQEKGLEGLDNVAVLPTYDLSFPKSPYGPVHNTDKQDVALRLAHQLRRLLYGDAALEGPRAVRATSREITGGIYEVTVTFGASPLQLAGTRNCSDCCAQQRRGADFDVSADGQHWTQGAEAAVVGAGAAAVRFRTASALPGAPKLVRYTASQVFPQCAVYGPTMLPAFPFQLEVTNEVDAATMERGAEFGNIVV
eukprot:TRINITY_DN47231_c0_g1_i1.p1 TRINITY_DN47231_c0_g1~~TRINITY_DN47231_c0_g1_i1.p1  ORF type:complete len:503 (+),score=44.60 TRINITY_DN47231_c0_g1_i1:66-1574(+)